MTFRYNKSPVDIEEWLNTLSYIITKYSYYLEFQRNALSFSNLCIKLQNDLNSLFYKYFNTV